MTVFSVLLRLRLRRDRFQLVMWLGSTFLVLLLSARALASTYDTQAERASLARLASANPAILALRGPPHGTSPGALLAFELMAYLGLLAGLLNTLLTVRHTRAEEDSGRSELIGATRAGRAAPVLATIVEALLVAVALAVAVGLASAASGLGFAGSMSAGLAVAGCGLAFAGIGLLCGEVFSSSRAANGWAATSVGAAFVLRAVGDATGTASTDQLTVQTAWPAWLSPIGWAQQTDPWTSDRLWPVLLSVGLGSGLAAVALAVHGVRDLGTGLVPDRPRRSTASPSLRGPLGLAWRLQRGSIIGWSLGALALAVVGGRLGPAAIDAMEKNAGVRKILDAMAANGNGNGLQVFLVAVLGLIGLLVAGTLLQVVMRLQQDEAAGTAELVLGTRLSRLRWLGSALVVGVVSTVVVLVLCGLLIAAMTAGSGYGGLAGKVVAGSLAQLPAALVYLAVLALVFAVAPRATVGAGWGMLAAGTFLSVFGQLVGVPNWLRDLSPSSHTPALPLQDVHWSGAVWMVGISVVLVVVSARVLHRRDLAAG